MCRSVLYCSCWYKIIHAACKVGSNCKVRQRQKNVHSYYLSIAIADQMSPVILNYIDATAQNYDTLILNFCTK